MLKRSGTAVVLAVMLAPTAWAQGADAPEVDQALFDQGEEIYGTICVVCHQATGRGVPPAFPALDGNEHLEDAGFVVAMVHHGQGAMPPQPQLDEEELAAVATYVRNAWSNDFGGASVEEAAVASENAAEILEGHEHDH